MAPRRSKRARRSSTSEVVVEPEPEEEPPVSPTVDEHKPQVDHVQPDGQPFTDLEAVVSMLKPRKKEWEKIYWKSLESDPEGAPFTLLYDANESKRKRPWDEEDGEGENQDHSRPSHV